MRDRKWPADGMLQIEPRAFVWCADWPSATFAGDVHREFFLLVGGVATTWQGSEGRGTQANLRTGSQPSSFISAMVRVP